MNSKINRVLERIESRLLESAGVSPRDQAPGQDPHCCSIRDEFFRAMDRATAPLSDLYGMNDEDAFEFAADVGDFLHEIGLLPPFPDDHMNDAEIARWVNAAAMVNFPKRVLTQAATEGF